MKILGIYNMNFKKLLITASVLVLTFIITGCAAGSSQDLSIILSTTTSTEDSGLLSFILPYFTEETGIDVHIISVGTGAALQIGRDGEADVVLVHAREEEDRFVAEGYADERFDVMYNDFIIVGPAGIIEYNNNPQQTFRYIKELGLTFLSRGDNSGTHIKELEIWDYIGLDPSINPNYLEVGQGMGATIGMGVEMDAFLLTDRSTWLFYPDKGNLQIISEFSEILRNPYGIMLVNSSLNQDEGQALIDWMLSERGLHLISIYGIDLFGSPLFFLSY